MKYNYLKREKHYLILNNLMPRLEVIGKDYLEFQTRLEKLLSGNFLEEDTLVTTYTHFNDWCLQTDTYLYEYMILGQIELYNRTVHMYKQLEGRPKYILELYMWVLKDLLDTQERVLRQYYYTTMGFTTRWSRKRHRKEIDAMINDEFINKLVNSIDTRRLFEVNPLLEL